MSRLDTVCSKSAPARPILSKASLLVRCSSVILKIPSLKFYKRADSEMAPHWAHDFQGSNHPSVKHTESNITAAFYI